MQLENKSAKCVAECACTCSSMDGMERSVRLGLVALAVSDMVFCTLYLMSTWIPSSAKYSPYDSLLRLYFRIYHEVGMNGVRSVDGSLMAACAVRLVYW